MNRLQVLRGAGSSTVAVSVLAAALVLLVGAPAAYAAATLHVNAATGQDSPTCGAVDSPCQTIQQAVDNAASGDTIQVAAGTYDERVQIGEPLTLDGAQAGNRGSATRAVGTAATESIISQGIDLDSNANDVTIDGFLFNASTNQICLTCTTTATSAGPSDARIEDNVFAGYDNGGPTNNAIDVHGGSGGEQIVGNYFTSPTVDYGDHGGAVVQWNGGGGCDGSAVRDNIFDDADASALADIYFFCDDLPVSTITVSGNRDTIGGSSSFVNFQHIGGSGGEIDVTNNAITMAPVSQSSGMYFSSWESGVHTVNVTGNSLTGDPFRAVKLSTNAELSQVNIAGNDFSDSGVGVYVGSNSLTTGATLTLENNNLSGETGDNVPDPGAGVYIASGAHTPASITGTGNDLSGSWVGFYVSGNGLGPGASVTLHGNDLGGELGGTYPATNPPTHIPPNGVYDDSSSGGSVDALENWWGCNAGPGATGCSLVSGAATDNPWLVLGLSATPSAVSIGGSSTVTADLTRDSSGADASGSGTFPNGIGIAFAADLGTLSASSAGTSAGRASLTFSSAAPGTAHVSATLDSQTVSTALVIVPPPTISRFAPALAPFGGSVTVTGTNLGPTTSVQLGSVSVQFTVLSQTQLRFTVPAGAVSGHVSVVTPGGEASSAGILRVRPLPPVVQAITPLQGAVGTTVTITGRDLTGATRVAFNGTTATVYAVISDSEVTAQVPSGATTGQISVTTPAGTGRSWSTFTVLPVASPAPAIVDFTPTSGRRGTRVSIHGSGFLGATSVTFNGSPAPFRVLRDSTIVAIIPPGATTGRIAVTTPGGTATSSADFRVRTP